MLRETGFVIGGAILAATGALMLALLIVLGAGWEVYPAYMGSLLAIGFGLFFIQVGRGEGEDRHRALAELERGPGQPPA